MIQRLLLILTCLLTMAVSAQAEGPWSGVWETVWRGGGGGRLFLEQQGDRVTGTYPLYGGRVEGVATGDRLEGKWFEGSDSSGNFILVLGRRGDNFTGRFETNEWWTGERVKAPKPLAGFDLATPRDAFRVFLVAATLGRSGRQDAWGFALQAMDFGPSGANLSPSEKLQHVQDLFSVVDMTTIHYWSVPEHTVADSVEIELKQWRGDGVMHLTLARGGDGMWRIHVPSDEQLATDRRNLLASRGGRAPAADAFKNLQNPRDTMRTFLEGMADWNGAGRALALSTLDLSKMPESLRDEQGTLSANYLRRVLDHIGLIGLQSIPNDGADRSDYVHFSHPNGRIVIAPSGKEPDAPWKFTARTVDEVHNLYLATERLPPPLALPPGLIPNMHYFTLRDYVRVHVPGLLGRVGHVEHWQWMIALVAVFMSVVVGLLGARVITSVIAWLLNDGKPQPRSFFWSLMIAIALLVSSPVPATLGGPVAYRVYTEPGFGVARVLALSAAGWHLLGVIGDAISRFVDRTAAVTDDILATLLLAVARLGIVVAASLGVAYYMSIPVSGVVAGLSLGGLAFAFASRETLSNVFGAAILVSDRPFRRGDLINAGEVKGRVEHVGIRSTRVRTTQDSVMIVPNGKLADSTIDNLGVRRHRLVNATLLITSGGTSEKLDAFADAVRARIADDDNFIADKTEAGVTGIVGAGVEFEIRAQLHANSAKAERAARHRLLLDIVQLAIASGLRLGAGIDQSIAAETNG